MNIKSIYLKNFGSYKELELDFSEYGLFLIQGQTGAGKSTICDAIPWILFGRTAKNGSADDVLRWKAGKEPTTGTVKFNDGLEITRIRGNKQNDLYFLMDNGSNVSAERGKDLIDTQKRINEILGIDIDLYLSGSYFHEFSQTSQFFSTTPKNRREICEQLADLSLATSLQEKNGIAFKASKKDLATINEEINKLSSMAENLTRLQTSEDARHKQWEQIKIKKIESLTESIQDYEEQRSINVERLYNALESEHVCLECGQPITEDEHKTKHKLLIKVELERPNPYAKQLEDFLKEKNPYDQGVKDFAFEIADKLAIAKQLTKQKNELLTINQNHELLADLIIEFRSVLVRNVIQRCENGANRLLCDFFDAEIHIVLDVTNSEKLEVRITKDGNDCTYTQLSKGQRQILKLCFGAAVMTEISNHSGVSFNTLFFDEALDGMDDQMKMKAVKMIETLSLNKGVYLVEHSETVKALVNNKILVELVDGTSKICRL